MDLCLGTNAAFLRRQRYRRFPDELCGATDSCHNAFFREIVLIYHVYNLKGNKRYGQNDHRDLSRHLGEDDSNGRRVRYRFKFKPITDPTDVAREEMFDGPHKAYAILFY